jgi:hypothetical protein
MKLEADEEGLASNPMSAANGTQPRVASVSAPGTPAMRRPRFGPTAEHPAVEQGSIAESLTLGFVCFGFLAAAWLLVAVGMLRRGNVGVG